MNAQAPVSRPRTRDAGLINIRNALRVERLLQSGPALAAAARMTLAMPLLQAAIAVGVLNVEPWMGLLCLEGLLIGALAASQLKRAKADSRLVGLGAALLNAAAIGALGVFFGSHIFWVMGVITMIPVSALVLLPTGPNTVRQARAAFIAGMVAAFVLAGASRVCLVLAPATADPAMRQLQLLVAWGGYQVRGGNGTERALLRLRQAQTAFEAKEYARAFELANDGFLAPDGDPREIPVSPIARDLLDSLRMVKAQARYNMRWGLDDPLLARLRSDALDASTLTEILVRWGW